MNEGLLVVTEDFGQSPSKLNRRRIKVLGLAVRIEMGKGSRTSSLHAHSWEFWRLVAVIFTISFLVQIILFVTLAQFTQFSSCYSKWNSINLGAEDGTFEPTTRNLNAASPAEIYEEPVLELGSPSCVKAVSEVIPVNDSVDVPSLNCTCARGGDSAQDGHDNNPSEVSINALQPLTFPLHPFVKFSTYRLSLNTFFVVGLTSAVARAFDVPVYDCLWQKKREEPITTRADMIYIRWDENRMPYVPAIVNCTFPTAVGGDGDGGTLRLSVSIKPKRDSPSGTATVDVHRELKGEVQKFNKTTKMLEEFGVASLPYKFAFCGPPMHGRIRPDWIVSWLTYHYRLYEGMEGKVRFFFYNTGGLSDAGRKALDPFIKAGVIEVVNVFDEWHYPAHYHNQLLFINDCLQRTRYIAQWTLFHDFDEFLHIPPPNSLKSLLEKYEDRPWLTFASLPASWGYCTQLSQTQKALWPVEKMLLVEKQPECRNKKDPDPYLCLGPLGRRKYVVNPRKVLASGVHVVTIGTEPGGIDLNGTIARVHHYHGALAANNYLCGRDVNSSDLVENSTEFGRYVFDDSIARATSAARELLAPLLGDH